MTYKAKIIVIIGTVITFGMLLFICYQQHLISSKQKILESLVIEQKQLVDGIVRSQNGWATKDDVEKFVKDNGINLKAIQEDLDKLQAEITAVNIAVASSKSQHGTNIPTTPGTGSNPNPIDPANPDPYGYMKKQQALALNEQFGNNKIPIGSVGFSAWQKEPWNIDIKAREYHLATVVGTDENQRSYFYNKFTIKVDNKEYEVPISKAITKQVYPEAKWSWWNPKLFLTGGGGINVTTLPVNGNLNVGATFGFMSWGKYKPTPDISVLQTGIGYSSNNNEFAVIINPVAFNIGNATDADVLKNTYVGPSMQITHTGQIFAGANISVGF